MGVKYIMNNYEIIDNGLYKETSDRHNVIFVNDLYRNKIYQDFFIKMEQK